jgi:hypothetical protein
MFLLKILNIDAHYLFTEVVCIGVAWDLFVVIICINHVLKNRVNYRTALLPYHHVFADVICTLATQPELPQY